jgi:hypothetical protein
MHQLTRHNRKRRFTAALTVAGSLFRFHAIDQVKGV